MQASLKDIGPCFAYHLTLKRIYLTSQFQHDELQAAGHHRGAPPLPMPVPIDLANAYCAPGRATSGFIFDYVCLSSFASSPACMGCRQPPSHAYLRQAQPLVAEARSTFFVTTTPASLALATRRRGRWATAHDE